MVNDHETNERVWEIVEKTGICMMTTRFTEQQLPDSVRRFCDYLIENAEFTVPTPST
ncbi:MAG: hypothetical protein ACXVAF_11995 [Vulcanimicrobiaceae bacterium]